MAATRAVFCSTLVLAFVAVHGDDMGPLMTHDFTRDMTLTCNLTSFLAAHRDDFATITDVKVIQNTTERGEERTGKDVVLAALTTTGENIDALPSPHLLDSHRVFDISHYFFDRSQMNKTFFALLYTGVGMYDYGRYFCSIGYLASGHFTPNTYNTTALTLLPSTTGTLEEAGSSLKMSSGLTFTCSFTSDSDLTTSGHSVTIVREHSVNGSSEIEMLASWQNGRFTNSTTRTVVRRAVTIQNNQGVPHTVVLVVHRQNVLCKDVGTYTCLVKAPGGSVALNDSTVVDYVNGCPTPTPPPPPPCTSTGPTGAGVKHSVDRMLLAAVVVVLVGMVAVC